jgi:hypothetical protein
MKQFYAFLIVLAVAAPVGGVDFQKEILPIFEAHCVKCHNADKAMGKLKLDSAAGIEEKWSADAHLITKGDPEKSELYERLVLPKDDKKRMPKGADPLDQASIDLIAAWIKVGAPFTAAVVAAADQPAADTPAADTPVERATEEAAPSEKPALEPLPLPEVPAAPQEAIDQLIKSGAKVMNLYSGSNLLEVTFVVAPQPPTDETMKLLAGVAPQVMMLNLKNAQATDAGWSELAKLTNLTALNVQNSTFSDAAAKKLEGMERLESLNLYGTGVTDAVLEPLKSLKRLQKLYLWKTHVTYDAAAELGKEKPGLEWNLGWDHPVVARKRLEEQKQDFAELLKQTEAEANRLRTDLQVAEEAHKTAQERLKEVEDSLSKLSGEPAAEQEKSEIKPE